MVCMKCGAETKNPKFCCQSCAASYNNKMRQRRLRHCRFCGHELTNRQIKYCSNKCQAEHSCQQYIDAWKRGERNGMIGEYQVSHNIKRYIREKYDNKCSHCGWNMINPYTGKCPLEIEHIDGNYTNNAESNLTLLCPNCHS